MKKFVLLSLVFLMMTGLLFATGTQQATPAQAADPNAPVTIDVWCWNPRTNIFSMKTAETIYKRTHPNFSVNVIETASPDVQSKIVTILAANQTSGLPDVFLCQDNDLMKNILTFPNAFYPVSDRMDMSKFAPYKVEKGTVNGKSYGVPYDNAATGLFIRKDYIEQAGLRIEDFSDTTWERIVELGRIVKEKTGHPILHQTWDSVDILLGMLQSTGTWFFKTDGSLDMINNQTLRTALTIVKTMIDDGTMLMVNDATASNAAINNGTVAGVFQGSWIIGTISAEQSQAGKWAVVSTPRFANIPGAQNASNQGGSSWVIPAASQKITACVDFLDQTFGGSAELYETILPQSGHVGTWLPIASSPVYNAPHAFFGGQKVYADFVAWGAQVPRVKYGIYNYEARDAAIRAISEMNQGKTLDEALDTAQRNVQFLMQQ